MANPWDNDPVVASNPWDNDPVVDVVSQGGPRSFMARTLDQMDPSGTGRRAERRDYMASPQARLDRGRASLDMTARKLPGPIGGIYSALRTVEQGDDGLAGDIAGTGANVIRGGSSGVVRGTAMSFDDELMGLLLGDKAKEERRGQQIASQTDTPVSDFAGQLVGGIASPVSKPIAAASGARSGMNFTQAAMSGARGGFVGGGIYGAGAAEGGLGERIDGAGEGALFGAAGGAALGPLIQPIINKAQVGQFFPKVPGGSVLETARQQLGVPRSSIDGLRKVLRSGGYSGDDIDRGVVNIMDRLQLASETGDRAGLFALELQQEFPAASQNIQDVFQQLMTAPPTQGQTGRILTQALDDQYDSQGTYFEGVAQQRLGTATVADELRGIGERRAAIGDVRDRTVRYAATDARGRTIRNQQMMQFLDDFSDDREVMGSMRAAARQLGYKGKNEVADAIADNPALLLQKFGEVSGAQIRSPRGATPVLERARQESETLFDEMSRFTREADNLQFAKKDTGEKGPYKRSQQDFAENYSQEEAVQNARTMLQKARDPVSEDGIALWYDNLPKGEQQLVRTVWRQDLEKMLRGGNIDQDGAYLTNLKKLGLNSTLRRVLGEDGEAITRAIRQLTDEQDALTKIDPRKGLQERVVRGPAAERARNLYTTNPIARLGDRLPAMSQLADIAFMTGGQLPYITMAKQGAKVFRPRPPTREGLARILAMRMDPARLSRPVQGPQVTPVPVAGAAAGTAGGSQPSPLPAPLPLTAPAAPQRAVVAYAQTAEGRQAAARQNALQAQQRLAAARQAAADEVEVRALEVEAARTEAEARVAERQYEAARRVTDRVVREVAKAAKERERMVQRTTPQRASNEAFRQADDIRARAAEERLQVTQESNEVTLARREAAARQRAQQEAARIEAERRQGELEIAEQRERARLDAEARRVRDLNAAEARRIATERENARVASANDRAAAQREGVRATTERQESVRDRNAQNTALSEQIQARQAPTAADRRGARGEALAWSGMLATGAAAGGGAYALDRKEKYDRVQTLLQDPEFVKTVQRSLKAAGEYKGRADGRLDADVKAAIGRFNNVHGVKAKPNDLTPESLKKMEDYLASRGKEKQAEALREQQKPRR